MGRRVAPEGGGMQSRAQRAGLAMCSARLAASQVRACRIATAAHAQPISLLLGLTVALLVQGLLVQAVLAQG